MMFNYSINIWSYHTINFPLIIRSKTSCKWGFWWWVLFLCNILRLLTIIIKRSITNFRCWLLWIWWASMLFIMFGIVWWWYRYLIYITIHMFIMWYWWSSSRYTIVLIITSYTTTINNLWKILPFVCCWSIILRLI